MTTPTPTRPPTSSGATSTIPGPLGRWGTTMATHARRVVVVWLIVVAGLGSLAPSVFSDLAGAGCSRGPTHA